MRRNDREITEFSEMTDVMKRCDVCRLALNDEDGYPCLLPLNFGMEETDGRVRLYFLLETNKVEAQLGCTPDS